MGTSGDNGKSPNQISFSTFMWLIVAIGISGYHLFFHAQSLWALVLNIIILALGCALLGLAALARLITRKDAAGRVASQQREIFGGIHKYRSADQSDFRGLDRAFYDAAGRDLTQNGFRHIGDFVNVTLAGSWPRHRCVLRRFVSDDGTSMASAFHLKLLGAASILQAVGVVSRKLRTYECETELTDGTYLTTSNAAQSNRTSGYPFIDRFQFDADTPILEIVARHRERIRALGTATDGAASPVLIRTPSEYQAAQDRMQALKTAYRRSPDFDFRAELQSIRGRALKGYEIQFAAEVAARLQHPESS